MADSTLPQPAQRTEMVIVQGGGAITADRPTPEPEAESEPEPEPEVKEIKSEIQGSPDISKAQLKTLSNGLVVRRVGPEIKDDIMNLRFIKGEQKLFDNLGFNKPFTRKYILGNNPDSKHIGTPAALQTETLDPIDETVLKGSSIDAIEAWVKAKVGELKLETKSETAVVAVFEKELGGAEFKGQRMYSSPNNYDCLIHALLNATSPTFRSLDVPNGKNPIATYFRTIILHKLYENLIAVEQDPNTLARLKTFQAELLVPWKNLDVDVAEKFGLAYNVTVLVYEGDWTTLADNQANKIIIIHNPGVNHFEAISRGGYIFDYNTKWTVTKYTITPIRTCAFQEKDVIEKDGKRYIVLTTDLAPDNSCAYIYITERVDSINLKKIVQEVNEGILIKENLDSKLTDQYSVLKKGRAEKLVTEGKKSVDGDNRFINILKTVGDYKLVADIPDLTKTLVGGADATVAKAILPKINKEKFYDFWEIYVNEDGTDGFYRMTGRKADEMRHYMETVWEAHDKYLLEGALRYLQRSQDAKGFESLYQPPKEKLFDMFFERIPVPSNTMPAPSSTPTPEKEDPFIKAMNELKESEASVKGSFAVLETKYNEAMNIIKSRDIPQIQKLGAMSIGITKGKDEITEILLKEETSNGVFKKRITELGPGDELESTKKFVEDSKKIIDLIIRYKNAAVLSEKVIMAFGEYRLTTKEKRSKKQNYENLKIQYKHAVELITNPNAPAPPPLLAQTPGSPVLKKPLTKVLGEQKKEVPGKDSKVVGMITRKKAASAAAAAAAAAKNPKAKTRRFNTTRRR